ncbi:MAG: hypothetical protein LAT55_07020 [Opitutales bacterium]|nr:hypothetical protein [Opitutales bacterium]
MDQLSPELFWDTDPTALDPERHASHCIIRIVERGTRQEVRAAWSYYGEDRVRGILLKAPALSGVSVRKNTVTGKTDGPSSSSWPPTSSTSLFLFFLQCIFRGSSKLENCQATSPSRSTTLGEFLHKLLKG